MNVEIVPLNTIHRAFIAENLIEAEKALESPEFRALIASTEPPTEPPPKEVQVVIDKLIKARASS